MPSPVALAVELERHIQERTGRKVRDLRVELVSKRVTLHGRTTTYYVKQLAQMGVRDLMPEVELDNAIKVDA